MRGAPPEITGSIADLAIRAAELVQSGRRRLVGLSGPPGSGKSTMAAKLCAALCPLAAVISIDGFHLSNEILASRGLKGRKGSPETFDAYGYLALLVRLKHNSERIVYVPRFDRGLEQAIGSAVPIPSDTPLVIVEGNYLLLQCEPWLTARRYLDAVWYLDVPDPTRIERLIARHESYGRSAAEAAQWVESNDERNAKLVHASRRFADAVIALDAG